MLCFSEVLPMLPLPTTDKHQIHAHTFENTSAQWFSVLMTGEGAVGHKIKWVEGRRLCREWLNVRAVASVPGITSLPAQWLCCHRHRAIVQSVQVSASCHNTADTTGRWVVLLQLLKQMIMPQTNLSIKVVVPPLIVFLSVFVLMNERGKAQNIFGGFYLRQFHVYPKILVFVKRNVSKPKNLWSPFGEFKMNKSQNYGWCRLVTDPVKE